VSKAALGGGLTPAGADPPEGAVGFSPVEGTTELGLSAIGPESTLDTKLSLAPANDENLGIIN
jgi:hypothetical protein